MPTTTGADIAAFLGRPLRGAVEPVIRPMDIAVCGPGDLVWVRAYTPERLACVETRRPALTIADPETAERTTVPCISSARPRLDFVRVLREFFLPVEAEGIHPTALVTPGAVLGERVSLGAYVRIGPEVTLGDDCCIGSGTSLEGRVQFGRRCRVKANSVIGAPGFGFEYGDDGVPLHFPHVGSVILEDDVWVGACSTIERATLDATRLGQGCKVDDLVQIGHNATVGRNSLIMANVVLCGGAAIGARCWIAPNSVVKEHVRIGDGVTVGLGAVVIGDVEAGLTVAGVPAKPLARRGVLAGSSLTGYEA